MFSPVLTSRRASRSVCPQGSALCWPRLSRAPVMRDWQRDHPIRVDYTGSSTGRAFAERQTVHIADVLADPTYTYRQAQELGGFRTLLSVPLLQGDRAIGVIALWRTVPRPF